MLGKSLSVPSHRQREEPALPGERRQRGGVCARERLGGEGRPDLLPLAARGRGEEREGDPGGERTGH